MHTGLEAIRLARAFARHSRLTARHVRTFQQERLRRLVRHACDRVPFYRRLFEKHRLDPGSIQGVGDLPRIPLVGKNDLRPLPVADTLAQGLNPDRLERSRSSGSTGEPFTIRRTWLEMRILAALRRRMMRYYGIHPIEKGMRVIEMAAPEDRRIGLHVRLAQAVGLFRFRKLSCRLPPEELLRALRAYRPSNLRGYASVLALLAQTSLRSDERGPPLRTVLSGAETLTPRMRRQIQEAFGANVYSVYSTQEFNVIAWECRETGLFHVCDDGVVVEIIRDDGQPARPGEPGDVVVTGLHGLAMPLIRFRLNDVAIQGDGACPCGAPFSTLRDIVGRTTDYFFLPDGRRAHPFDIITSLLDRDWIGRIQIIQERLDQVVVRLLPLSAPAPGELDAITDGLSALLGERRHYTVELVDDIAPDRGGKIPVFKSLVNSNQT